MGNQSYLGDPESTLQGGKDVESAGTRLKEAISRRRKQIEAVSGGQPWGNDDTGKAFKDNYTSAEDDYFHGAPLVGDGVEGIGKGIQGAVSLLANTDGQNAGVINTVGNTGA